MIYVTGDCHGSFDKLSLDRFPQQKKMTKEDLVVICGDFGAVWDYPVSNEDRYWLDWLDKRPFTTVFCDGNHENFDMLKNNFETVAFHGGKAHKIRNSIYHLMRGYIFDFDGMKFFVFGGASSHDISGGILDRDDFKTEREYTNMLKQWRKEHRLFRINHKTWWKEELPSDEEYANAEKNLMSVGYKVDYVITHSAPQSVVEHIYTYHKEEPNHLTLWFDKLKDKLVFNKWYFGHYHKDMSMDNGFILLYDEIAEIKKTDLILK